MRFTRMVAAIMTAGFNLGVELGQVAVVTVVTVLKRRLDAAGRDPVAASPPRVTDFTR